MLLSTIQTLVKVIKYNYSSVKASKYVKRLPVWSKLRWKILLLRLLLHNHSEFGHHRLFIKDIKKTLGFSVGPQRELAPHTLSYRKQSLLWQIFNFLWEATLIITMFGTQSFQIWTFEYSTQFYYTVSAFIVVIFWYRLNRNYSRSVKSLNL